jgi:hypothetical protein
MGNAAATSAYPRFGLWRGAALRFQGRVHRALRAKERGTELVPETDWIVALS